MISCDSQNFIYYLLVQQIVKEIALQVKITTMNKKICLVTFGEASGIE